MMKGDLREARVRVINEALDESLLMTAAYRSL